MRRSAAAFLLLALVFVSKGTSAAPNLPYPVESFTWWLDNALDGFTDPALGRYNFEAGLYGAARRAIQRYPERYLDPDMDVRHELQVAIDAIAHNRPSLPYSHIGDAGHPMFLPDWDHDGVFGDSGGTAPGDTGDYDAESDTINDTAYFRAPCYDETYHPHHRYASGACDTGDAGSEPYEMGVAHEMRVVNARGLELDVTLWLPMKAFAGNGCPALGSASYTNRESWTGCVAAANLGSVSLPGVVFANGLASLQNHYYWFAMRMAAAGYVVMTYDPAGQGESEGTGGDLFARADPNPPEGVFPGTNRDVQDMVRWFVGHPIVAVPYDDLRFEPPADPAANPSNPAAPVLDEARVGLAGNSMGALATISYVQYLERGVGADGRPLPQIKAAIPMSGASGAMRAVVPVQLQTFDYDGSPAFIVPAAFGTFLGFGSQGIGYPPMKRVYDEMRASGQGHNAVSFVVMEGGVHTDHVDQIFVPRTLWGISVAGDYAQAWLDCHVAGIASACATAASPAPHLSRGFASEIDADGPAGPGPSRCIRAPDQAMLNQAPRDFVAAMRGQPAYDCVP